MSAQTQVDYTSLEFNSVENNIFQRPITALVLDKYGFIWIGTEGAGLYRFNGKSYSYYRHDLENLNSINSNSISALFLDKSGKLWVGTDAGLCFYDENQNSFKRFEAYNGENLNNNYEGVLCFSQYEDEILVGTYDGIKKLDLENCKLLDYGFSGQTISDLKFTTKGNLYVATTDGLKLERYYEKGQIEHISLQNSNSVEQITRLELDKQENLWVGTLKSGTFKGDLKNARTKFSKLNIGESATMAIISNVNSVFVALENEGLFIFNAAGELIQYYRYNAKNTKGIGSDSIWSMLLDEEDRLWLGYYENGLGFFDQNHSKFKSIQREDFKNSILTNDIKAFAKTNDELWIAQINAIDILDTNTHKVTNVFGALNSKYKGLNKDLYIENIFIDSKGNTWVATWGQGIFLLKKGTKTFLNFNKNNTQGVLKTNKVQCFTEDLNGNVWIGSFLEGVYYYDSADGKIKIPTDIRYTNSEIINKDVKVIYYDSSGYLWVGTSSGLYHIDNPKVNQFNVIAHSEGLLSKFSDHPSSSRILEIYETQDGTIWCGTNGGGLFTYKRGEESFERFELADYDLSFVNAIFEPVKDQLWLSSKQGILKIDRNLKQVIQFTKYDGLLENFLIDRAMIKDNNNVLYLGTKSGVNTIEPQNIKSNPYLAKPYLKDVRIFNKKLNHKDKDSLFSYDRDLGVITLQHDQTVLTIDYEAISYTRPEKNQYAYFLDGFDENWNYVGSKTSATYTNLESGNYRFKLKVSNNDNLWNEASTILKINVLPPWWKTIWAYLLYMLLLVLAIYAVMFYYKKRISERNTYRLERERRKQKVELQQQKLQFFTNISHEFRTPLTLIINPIKDLIELDDGRFSKSVSQKYQIIHKNAERLSRLINELMDFRKLQSNKLQLKLSEFNVVNNVKNILSFFNEESNRRSIQLDLKYEDVNLEIWADNGLLGKILFNLLSNAFKVTPNKGRILVKIYANKSRILPLVDKNNAVPVIEISVKDNGPGIDQKDYKKIFERFYQISELNKSYYGSTGVGLEMVQSFVKLHKGIVEVDSELGKGSVFKIFLPRDKKYLEDLDSSFSKNNEELLSKSQLENQINPYKIEDLLSKKQIKKKLLIVEDNVDLQDYLISILEQDYDLVIANDGQEGWFKAIEHRPDIIITDVIMPVMDGLDFSKKVKSDPNLSQIPIVMLTAKDLTKDRIKGLESGAEAYLVKPFDTKELKVILEQLLLKKTRMFKHTNTNVIQEEKDNADGVNLDNDFIQRVMSYIQDNIENTALNVETLSSHLCLSRSQVYRKIKNLTGLSPVAFIRRIRLERSKTMFENNKNLNVSEVAHKVGFLSASYFTVCYKKQFGELPKRKK
ncbi:hybrid sensor histidine kinase/response regulator transcription factor [uncultured Winogradskyella sp.]|uniref:hybrid sensor histidine kinase/response regulator transcription factor n=1 Tax=uncultured Winogradskyella sp. TaxID=395353 RepID=UPI002629D066|nr:hybrid sensor histidine kinase/response regulator transcription factor [uncultured Winogradskyella sp.]